MGEWLPSGGRRMRDEVSCEIYRNTPADVPKDKLETELYVRLVKPPSAANSVSRVAGTGRLI